VTERIHSLTVILSEDMREDDAKALIDAVLMLKGVGGVATNVADVASYMAEQRARNELGEKLLAICYPRMKEKA
jgi:hypothetical protein